ncbi:hypothetical protein GCM10023185_20620 [Hymenobacter saemangeumensis]|uniref:Uncharacterized protein n=1 Tax=Hymenobacter saemangeumensis TaxID=1084522 RepID=A0ABP8IDI7_9BACT
MEYVRNVGGKRSPQQVGIKQVATYPLYAGWHAGWYSTPVQGPHRQPPSPQLTQEVRANEACATSNEYHAGN